MNLPSRTTVIVLIFFLAACSLLVGWIFGFYTPENATFRDWYELIASISVVVFVLAYSAVKRFKRSSVS
jgi:hypothetical protein